MSLVDIRPLDLADDAEMRAAYDATRRAELVGREDAPHWSFENFLGAMRSTDSGERMESFVGFVDGELVSFGVVYLFLLDNTDKGFLEVRVDPDHRRKGYGRQMLEHLLAIFEEDGRTQVLAETKVPIDEVQTHPNTLFLRQAGFVDANVELVRYQTLPVADADIQAWIDQRRREAPGRLPDRDLRRRRPRRAGARRSATLFGQLAVDAPTGEVDFEEEVMTPGAVRRASRPR